MSDNDSEIISTKCKSKTKEKNNVISKKPRKILTSKQKKMLYQFARDNPNFTQQELADKFEIGRTTVADILAQSLYWLGLDEENYPQLEEILAQWFDLVLENYLTIIGLILQEKAKQVAATLKIQNFAVSDEAASAPIKKLPKFHLSLQNKTSNYDLVNIYNCDETALCWLQNHLHM
ncbi:10046_t:CDS:2, partial [Dentiscutata heterogama]